MNDNEKNWYMKVAKEVALIGGQEALKYFRVRNLKIENKSQNAFDPVTSADKMAERVMRQEIIKKFPNDGIIGEEFGNSFGSSNINWIIDPIDGTRAFLSGTPSWGVMVAVNDGIRPIIGVIFQPFTGEIFVGTGREAFYQYDKKEVKISVRKRGKLANSILFSTFPEIGTDSEYHQFQKISQKVKMTRYGFDCYAYALLAMGLVDVVMEAGLKSYDIQPPQALIQSAGGIVSSWKGCDPQFGGTFLACGDERVHTEILNILSRR